MTYERVTPQRVHQAQLQNNVPIITSKWALYDKETGTICGACALSQLVMQKEGIPEPFSPMFSSIEMVSSQLNLPRPYVLGFVQGFDNQDAMLPDGITDDAEYGLYTQGYKDGKEVGRGLS